MYNRLDTEQLIIFELGKITIFLYLTLTEIIWKC